SPSSRSIATRMRTSARWSRPRCTGCSRGSTSGGSSPILASPPGHAATASISSATGLYATGCAPCMVRPRPDPGGRPNGSAGDAPWAADHPHLAAVAASAVESTAAIRFEPRHAHAGRHREPFEHLSRSRIDSPQLALVIFPGAMPQLVVGPGDARDEAVRLDRAERRPRFGIDLVDLPVPVLPDPERPFGPCEAGDAPAAGGRDRGEHATALRIDLP